MTLRDDQRAGLWEKDRVSTGRLAESREVPSHGNEGPERKLFESLVMVASVVRAGTSTSTNFA
jgi:hypothetical protein